MDRRHSQEQYVGVVKSLLNKGKNNYQWKSIKFYIDVKKSYSFSRRIVLIIIYTRLNSFVAR